MNEVRVLEGGHEAFPRMLTAIRTARRRVLLESYIFLRDEVGKPFIDELSKAASRGVRVTVLIDGFGSPEAARIAAALRQAGAEVRVHGGGWFRLLFGQSLRNHRKLLLVDGDVAFAGGINIAAAHAAWADLAVEVRGPVCGALAGALERRGHMAADCQVDFLLSGPRGGRRLRRRYLKAIARARGAVRLAQAYFLPDLRLVRALTSAARRGVDVRVLLTGPFDVPLIRTVAAGVCRRLIRGGVRVFRWTSSVMHAKAACVDARLLLVGSFNLDPMSQVNEEILVEARDPAAARHVEGWFDRHAVRELTLADCRPQPFADALGRLLSWAAFVVAGALRRGGKRRAPRMLEGGAR